MIVQPLNPARRPATASHRAAFDFIAERWGAGRPVTTAGLAIHLGKQASATVYIVGQLERRGWITRHRNPGNKRELLLEPKTYSEDET